MKDYKNVGRTKLQKLKDKFSVQDPIVLEAWDIACAIVVLFVIVFAIGMIGYSLNVIF